MSGKHLIVVEVQPIYIFVDSRLSSLFKCIEDVIYVNISKNSVDYIKYIIKDFNGDEIITENNNYKCVYIVYESQHEEYISKHNELFRISKDNDISIDERCILLEDDEVYDLDRLMEEINEDDDGYFVKDLGPL